MQGAGLKACEQNSNISRTRDDSQSWPMSQEATDSSESLPPIGREAASHDLNSSMTFHVTQLENVIELFGVIVPFNVCVSVL